LQSSKESGDTSKPEEEQRQPDGDGYCGTKEQRDTCPDHKETAGNREHISPGMKCGDRLPGISKVTVDDGKRAECNQSDGEERYPRLAFSS